MGTCINDIHLSLKMNQKDMTTFPVLKFEPLFKSVIWGGKRIAEFKGIPSQGDTIGESWELSCVPGNESVVVEGEFKGRNLKELLLEFPTEIMGEKLLARYGKGEFPLLIKLIDSADDLSVQVHPDDELAGKRHNCLGKIEMWISVAPADDAYLYAGLKHAITPDEYRSRIADNTIIDCLCKYYPKAGDVFFLPAGRVHSIGKGNFVLEIEETCDITYRIYDYDRRDAKGNPRQLHVEESIDAVNFNDTADSAPTAIPAGKNVENTIADCHHFTTTAIDVDGAFELSLAERKSFTVIAAISGDAEVVDGEGRATALKQGTTALIPASMPAVTVRGNARIITTFVK